MRGFYSRLRWKFGEDGLANRPIYGIGVDSENPSGAHRMYERLGFEVERREIVLLKPITG